MVAVATEFLLRSPSNNDIEILTKKYPSSFQRMGIESQNGQR